MARTLGAGRLYLIFRVALPSALPNIFLGLFMGLGASFLTLIVAETVGVQSGLGWYLTWQQGYVEFDKVYAALLIMVVFFSTLMTLLFAVRDRVSEMAKGGDQVVTRPGHDGRRRVVADRPRREQNLPRRRRFAGAGAGPAVADGRGRGNGVAGRAERLRQIDAAAADRRAGRADGGRDRGSERRRSPAPAPSAAWCSRTRTCSRG